MQQPWYLSGKCPRVLVLKKIVNSTQTFLLACDVAVVPLHKLFSLIRQTAIILKDKTQFLLFHTRKKIFNNNINKFKSFLLWGICKSRLYLLDITDFRFLVSSCILNEDCISKKSSSSTSSALKKSVN